MLDKVINAILLVAFRFFCCYSFIFQFLLVFYFLSFVEFQPALFLILCLLFANLSLMFFIRVVPYEKRVSSVIVPIITLFLGCKIEYRTSNVEINDIITKRTL